MKTKKSKKERVLEHLIKARHIAQDEKAEARMQKKDRKIREWDELDVLIGKALQWATDLVE